MDRAIGFPGSSNLAAPATVDGRITFECASGPGLRATLCGIGRASCGLHPLARDPAWSDSGRRRRRGAGYRSHRSLLEFRGALRRRPARSPFPARRGDVGRRRFHGSRALAGCRVWRVLRPRLRMGGDARHSDPIGDGTPIRRLSGMAALAARPQDYLIDYAARARGAGNQAAFGVGGLTSTDRARTHRGSNAGSPRATGREMRGRRATALRRSASRFGRDQQEDQVDRRGRRSASKSRPAFQAREHTEYALARTPFDRAECDARPGCWSIPTVHAGSARRGFPRASSPRRRRSSRSPCRICFFVGAFAQRRDKSVSGFIDRPHGSRLVQTILCRSGATQIACRVVAGRALNGWVVRPSDRANLIFPSVWR